MPANWRQLDSVELDTLRLPYDRFAKKLQRNPLLVAGSNVYASQDNTLRKRGGSGGVSALTSETLTGRIDRLGTYQTFENPSKSFLIASVFNSGNGKWEMWYLRVDDSTPQWTQMSLAGSGLNNSDRAHEWVVAKGKVYIKAYPNTAGALGSVVFDGSGGTPTTTLWGLLPPTQAARITTNVPTAWPGSSNTVTVKVGWTYVYTWKTLTGHESSRSPLEGDPAQLPSTTPAFGNRKPQITLRGHPDTTNVTHVVVYRSSDGGGNYMRLEEIANPGDVNFTFTDDGPSGTDPYSSLDLNTSDLSPSLVSNQPPPSVAAPEVVGVDVPAESTRLVHWQGRIWFGIGSTLFYSGQEEIRNGEPEESFPSGILGGNKFLYQERVTHLIPTKDILYVVTRSGVEAITGDTKDTFRSITVGEIVGGAEDHPHASTSIQRDVFWLTHDFQIARGRFDRFQIISLELGSDLTDAITAGAEIELAPHFEPGIAWLVVLAKRTDDETASKVFVYDLQSGQWNPPWTGIHATSVAYGPFNESDRTPRLLFGAYANGSNTALAAYYTDSTFTDIRPGAAAANISFNLETSLFPVPVGNRVNSVSRPGMDANFSGFKLEWVSGVTDPTVEFALDDSTGTVSAATAEDPSIKAQASGYVQKFYPIDELADRVKLKVSRSADNESFVLETVAAMWQTTQAA